MDDGMYIFGCLMAFLGDFLGIFWFYVGFVLVIFESCSGFMLVI